MLIRDATEADRDAIVRIYNHAVVNSTATFDIEPFTVETRRAWFEKHDLLAEITVSDPVYLAEPVTFRHRWKKLADRDVIQAPCTMEAAQLYLEAGYEDREE